MNLLIGKNGKQIGTFSEDQVRSMLETGVLTGADLAWTEGRPDWIPLWQLFGMAPPLHPQQAFQQQPAPTPTSAAPVIIAGYACAAVSLVFFPIIFGPLGVALGIVTLMRKETVHGAIIIALSCSMACIGFALGAAMFTSGS